MKGKVSFVPFKITNIVAGTVIILETWVNFLSSMCKFYEFLT